MQATRRTLITGAAATLGGAVLLSSRPARAAAAVAQELEVIGLAGLVGSEAKDPDGFCPSGIELNPGSATATLLWTQFGEDRTLAGFGMTSAKLEQAMLMAPAEDFRLRSLVAQGGDLYGVLFERGGQPAPALYHRRQTAAEYQAMVTTASRSGMEPVQVSVDNHDGAPRFTTLLRRSTTAWEARHGVKPAELSALTTAMKAKGLRPARLTPYLDGGQLRFLTLYRPAGRHAWESWTLSAPDFASRVQRHAQEGYALLQATRYDVGGATLWVGIWQKAAGVPQDYFWGV